ncbi:MAG: class I SAM-dependent methyltransferase [Proteobacteria bacterium]|nr:class I SAM-dependent methyltransferase [Pseudomonadota bacterium]
MYLRESSMPAQDYWESLFDADAILTHFGLHGDVAELGCGYGTFTLPLARRTRGTVHAIDIDPTMVETVQRRAADAGLDNIKAAVRDVMAGGFAAADATLDGVVLFNILHGELPLVMLTEARRVLKPGGTVAVIHWRSDIATPRGPNLAIRPSPAAIIAWVAHVGGLEMPRPPFLLPPWHFGLEFTRQ